MAAELPQEPGPPWVAIDFPLRALAALGALPGLTCGGLSPLARLRAPAEAPDGTTMAVLLARAEALSPWALPTMLDPQLTVAVVVGEQDEPALRQYAWLDAAGTAPGFEFIAGEEALTLQTGLDLPTLRTELAALLALDDIADQPTLSISLSAREFWVLVALMDAYRMSLAARRRARLGGRPQAVLVSDIVAAWQQGLASRHPGWAVSLFSFLAPSDVPPAFERMLRDTLEELDDADLLVLLEGDGSDGRGATVVFGDGLGRMMTELSGPLLMFGLAVHRAQGEGEAALTTLGGWRTQGCLWLADLPGLADDTVRLVLASGGFVHDLLASVLAGEPNPQFASGTPWSARPLLDMLASQSSAGPAAVAPTSTACAYCGAELDPRWKFCPSCTGPVAGP